RGNIPRRENQIVGITGLLSFVTGFYTYPDHTPKRQAGGLRTPFCRSSTQRCSPVLLPALCPKEEGSKVTSLVVCVFPTASWFESRQAPGTVLMVSGAFLYPLGGGDGDEIVCRQSSL